jgi:hypothetical protein
VPTEINSTERPSQKVPDQKILQKSWPSLKAPIILQKGPPRKCRTKIHSTEKLALPGPGPPWSGLGAPLALALLGPGRPWPSLVLLWSWPFSLDLALPGSGPGPGPGPPSLALALALALLRPWPSLVWPWPSLAWPWPSLALPGPGPPWLSLVWSWPWPSLALALPYATTRAALLVLRALWGEITGVKAWGRAKLLGCRETYELGIRATDKAGIGQGNWIWG